MDHITKILILSEGGPGIGLGHIARCSALYEAFEERGASPSLVINGDKSVRALLRGKRIKIFNWLKRKQELFDLVSGADVIVIDSYLAGIGFYKKISGIVKIPVYLDDNRRLHFPRGMVVNGSIYAKRLNYPSKEGRSYLLGVKYAPLRKEFHDIPDKKIKRKVQNILVTLGGNDSKNIAPKVLKFLARDYTLLNKTIIIGKGSSNMREVEKLKDDKTDLIYYPDANEVKEAMLGADIAISAGGQTLYELARVGLPAVAIAVSKNQLNNIKRWQETGFIEDAGWYNRGQLIPMLSRGLGRLMPYSTRRNASKLGRRYVDGKGSARIANEIFDLLQNPGKAEKVRFRQATEDDCLDLLSWRNHPDVRRWSYAKKEISYPEHKSWFSKKICDKFARIYIAEVKGFGKIGQIRFDMDKDRASACVNVNLNPIFLGKGLGSRVIAEGTDFFLKENPSINVVKAEIFNNNAASRKAFQKADYIYLHRIAKDDKRCSLYEFQKN